ncbi:MAG: S-layer homology domain-containing protein [Eubacteriales bacterium]
MRNLKKFLAMALTMLMVVSSFSGVLSSYAFDDVTDSADEINLMSSLHIIKGYEDGTFGPENDVLRYQMALMIAKIMTGKVDNEYVNWGSTANYSTFTDIDDGDFQGSVSYCNENGIVVGYDAATFGPDDGITVQQAFTMVVRMLGYGSASMDANYPWSYVDKAIELGLDNGLAADYNNEDTCNREQAAVILYNALFAKQAAGTTFATSMFNLTTSNVIVTGTNRGNMYKNGAFSTKLVPGTTDEYYVAFNVLGSDFKADLSTTYYLPESAFGLYGEDIDANDYIGASFEVVTRDNYASLLYCEMNDSYAADQTAFKGGDANNTALLKIDSDSYNFKAVEKFSALNNNQGYIANYDEILVYADTNAVKTNNTGLYYYDANMNITTADGKTVIFYYISFNNSALTAVNGVYRKLVSGTHGTANAVYVDPTADEWAAVPTYGSTTTVVGMTYITNTKTEITDKNAYSDTVLYDDNNDGTYDRAFYTYYSFAKIGKNNDGYITVTDNGGNTTVLTKLNGDKIKDTKFVGEAAKYDDVAGKYVIYSYNAILDTLTVKKIYTVSIGYVTTLNMAAPTISFDQVFYDLYTGVVSGTTYTLGCATLPGASFAGLYKSMGGYDEAISIKGRTVNFILDEDLGAVLAIANGYTDAGYVIYLNRQGYTTTGNQYAQVITSKGVATWVTIASVNNVTNFSAITLEAGQLYKATVDALGNYHLTAQAVDTSVENYGFTNGIGTSNNLVAETPEFTPSTYLSNADTVYVVLAGADKTIASNYRIFKGIPANGVTLNGVAFVQDTNAAKFVYATDNDLTDFVISNVTNTTYNSYSIIYVDNDYQYIGTNQVSTGFGVINGTYLTYSRVVDVINGGLTNIYATTDKTITRGHFYLTQNNIVLDDVTAQVTATQKFVTAVDAYGLNANTVNASGDKAADIAGALVAYKFDAAAMEITDGDDGVTPKDFIGDYKGKTGLLITALEPRATVLAAPYADISFTANAKNIMLINGTYENVNAVDVTIATADYNKEDGKTFAIIDADKKLVVATTNDANSIFTLECGKTYYLAYNVATRPVIDGTKYSALTFNTIEKFTDADKTVTEYNLTDLGDFTAAATYYKDAADAKNNKSYDTIAIYTVPKNAVKLTITAAN